jgi:hypothetical protein
MTDENRAIAPVEDALGLAAARLAIDGDSGYTDGYERQLADEVYAGIPAGKRAEVLRWLVGCVVSSITTGAVNMLDETSEDTYAVCDEITGRLVAAIIAQGRAGGTLLHLIAHEIGEREHMERVLKAA